MACTASKTPLLRAVAARGYSASAKAAACSKPRSFEVQCTTLPNKLVVASVDSDTPVSRVSILFRAGARNETADNLGASHYIRNAAGYSTCSSTGFGITRNIQDVGGSLTATTDREVIGYSIDVTRDRLDTALQYLQHATTRQIFKPWEIADGLPRMNVDLSRVPDDVLAVELLHKASFHLGLGNSVFAPYYQIGKLSTETLQHYFLSLFTTNRTAVAGVGIDHKLLVAYAQNLPIESGNCEDNVSRFIGSSESRWDKGGNFASVAIATEGTCLKNRKEALALAVLRCAAAAGTFVSDGKSQGALSKVVRKAAKNPVKINAFNVSYTDTGLFGFVVTAHASDAGKVVDCAVNALKSGNISIEDICRGKAILKTSILYNLENSINLADDIGNQAVLLGQAQHASCLLSEIDSLPESDVQEAAKKISCGSFSVGAVGNIHNVPRVCQIN